MRLETKFNSFVFLLLVIYKVLVEWSSDVERMEEGIVKGTGIYSIDQKT